MSLFSFSEITTVLIALSSKNRYDFRTKLIVASPLLSSLIYRNRRKFSYPNWDKCFSYWNHVHTITSSSLVVVDLFFFSIDWHSQIISVLFSKLWLGILQGYVAQRKGTRVTFLKLRAARCQKLHKYHVYLCGTAISALSRWMDVLMN